MPHSRLGEVFGHGWGKVLAKPSGDHGPSALRVGKAFVWSPAGESILCHYPCLSPVWETFLVTGWGKLLATFAGNRGPSALRVGKGFGHRQSWGKLFVSLLMPRSRLGKVLGHRLGNVFAPRSSGWGKVSRRAPPAGESFSRLAEIGNLVVCRECARTRPWVPARTVLWGEGF